MTKRTACCCLLRRAAKQVVLLLLLGAGRVCVCVAATTTSVLQAHCSRAAPLLLLPVQVAAGLAAVVAIKPKA